MWGYEQLFKKDKADFNDYLILFDLDIYYVEKLQIAVRQCTTDGTRSAHLFEIESSGLLLMQLPWLFVLKFPVFWPKDTVWAFFNWWKSKLELQSVYIISWQNEY